MTVQTNTNVASFNGDGANKVFPIGYKFNSAADLVVLLVDDVAVTTRILTLNSDFTVTGAGDDEGGTVTLEVAPTANQRLTIIRIVDILQLTDLRNQGKFYAEIHEDAFDLLTMIAQQHQSDIALSLRVAETDPEPARIPSVAQRAGKLLAFDAAGNPTTALPVADSSTELRQELASSSGAGLIQHSTSDPDSTQETIASLLDARPSVLNFGAAGDGLAVDDVAIQKMATACDLRQLRYVYIPNWGATYKITAPISIKYPGVRVFGDQGGTYNRGLGKLGWLEGASGLTRFFDLGASRTEGNPADHWQVDGLSFKQAPAATARTIDGVSFTMRQNGPDRGAKIRDCSFIGLKDAITVENPDIATVLGTLDVGGCVFQGCDSAINAKGMVFGLRFVGNQCEQNMGASGAGVIRGSINGPATIADNMLEGQPNVISIDIPGVTGNRPHLQSRGNYFEANSGAYVHRFRTSSPQASITVGPNYTQSITATDYVLIEESTGSMYMDVYDDFPVTFKNAHTTLKYGSNILRNRQRAYKVRQISAKPTEVVISDFAGLTDVAADHVHVSYGGVSVATLEDTPFGRRYCLNGTTFTTIPLSVAAGDLVVINLLCRAEEVVAGNLVPQIWNSDTTVNLYEWGGSGIATELAGKWALVSIAFVVSAASSSIRFRFTAPSGTYSTLLAGISAKNYGGFENDGISGMIITPVTPRLPNPAPYLEGVATYDPPALADGAGAQTTITINGASLGDFASATFSSSVQGVIVTAYVSSANTVTVRFQNETGATVDLASGTIRVRVQR